MDVLQAMQLFRRVAELESFTRVAEERGLSQSSVSKQVSALEGHLGSRLLVRSTRQLKLTDTGREYYERCIAILSDVEEAESLASSGQGTLSGLIRLNLPDTLGRLRILPHVWDFMALHPEIRVDIMMEDRRVDLVREGVDLAIRSGLDFDPAWITRRLAQVPRLLAASPDYLRRHPWTEDFRDLAKHDCIIYSLSPSGQSWRFDTPDGPQKVKVNGRVRVSSPEAAVAAAVREMGITLNPGWLMRDEIQAGRLVLLPVRPTPSAFEIHAIYPDRRFIPLRVRRFVDYLAPRLDFSPPG